MAEEKQLIRKRFGGLVVKVGLIALSGMALVGCREKNVESKNVGSSYVKKVVDEEEFTILLSDRTKPSFFTDSEFLWDDTENNPSYVRYHGMSNDEGNFVLSSDSNTPYILVIGMSGGKKALDEIKPPLKPHNNYYNYSLDSKQITLLNKNYGVVSIDPNHITLRKIKE
ncbi:MAG: hypothetical protein Q8N63_08845 [Nanoarchaeota archaeon]|nr:hypothetical protein [Nanoarchaeota archaeon]